MFKENMEPRMNKLQVPPQPSNEIITYINGKAIIEDEAGDFYFVEMDEEHVSIGESVLKEDLTPISALTTKEQENILQAIR